jgi:hypothetical protein
LPRQTVVKLSPTEKDKYYDQVIVDILQANPTGVSAAEIEKATGFYGRTVRDHLKNLSNLGKAYGITRSGVVFYFPSGKIEDEPLVIPSKTRDGLFYVVNILTNQRGKFAYIQQKEMDEYRTLIVKGGILIAEEDIKDFITKMHTYYAKKKEK